MAYLQYKFRHHLHVFRIERKFSVGGDIDEIIVTDTGFNNESFQVQTLNALD